MKYFVGLILILSMISACATSKPALNDEIDDTIEKERIAEKGPGWYDHSIASASDSTAFHGYSHATASARSDAVRISENMAIVNLRFGIDKFAEQVRRGLEEDSAADHYSSGRFIITLRNSVQELSLDDAELTTEVHDQNGGVYAFTRASLFRDVVISKLSGLIDDSGYNAALNEH
jgi:hypothetical protein